VEGPAAVVVVDAPAEEVAGEEVAEGVAELVVVVVSFDLFAWHPEPISANAAITDANATVRLPIWRISFLSNSDRTEIGFVQSGCYCGSSPTGNKEFRSSATSVA
jgi:hypothetical protein